MMEAANRRPGFPERRRNRSGMRWLDPQQMRILGRVTGFAAELVAATVIGYLGGDWLDRRLGVRGLAWVGLVLGLVAGTRSFLRLVHHLRRELDDDSTRSAPHPPDPDDDSDPAR